MTSVLKQLKASKLDPKAGASAQEEPPEVLEYNEPILARFVALDFSPHQDDPDWQQRAIAQVAGVDFIGSHER